MNLNLISLLPSNEVRPAKVQGEATFTSGSSFLRNRYDDCGDIVYQKIKGNEKADPMPLIH